MSNVSTKVVQFIEEVKQSGFLGEIEEKYSQRLMLATDNSIYEILPDVCLYPKKESDVVLVVQLMHQERFQSIKITPRGGGTGTNGQSLNQGIIIDFSRHMNKILKIDPESRTAIVQCGVVKDQLNQELKKYGLFFAPELSTSNRATIGGMINTDASGQGSCAYGKTRDHVLGLKTILLNGEVLKTSTLSKTALEQKMTKLLEENPNSIECKIYSYLSQTIKEQYQTIQNQFPKLNRCLTGYDLAHVWNDSQDIFDLNSIFCGSEGTLGFITEATLNCLYIPKHTALVNIGYESFQQALQDTQYLMNLEQKPTSIEVLDDNVISLARNEMSWQGIKEFFEPSQVGKELTIIKGINLIEFNADANAELSKTVDAFIRKLNLDDQTKGRINITVAYGSSSVNKIYTMRKKAVGLLGNLEGKAKPVPFVEDTAVPPENLVDYITEFRQLLDEYQLKYGMFGHADAGVLHVRPALDLKNADDRRKIKIISDQVAELCLKYQGVLWGEHGKGIRSGYAPEYFGDLYPIIQTIKSIFDPYYQLNFGKIATPLGFNDQMLYQIDQVQMRGDLDQKIAIEDWQKYESALYCNGNGACFNYDVNEVMCPSYKATKKVLYSPKGRAMLIKEWLRQKSDLTLNQEQYQELTIDIKDSMDHCLACKACSSQCPIKVDISEFRSKFLSEFHKQQSRSLRDYFLLYSETFAPFIQKLGSFPSLMDNRLTQIIMKQFGLIDLPKPQKSELRNLINQGAVKIIGKEKPSIQSNKSIIIVPDAFTQFFDPSVLCNTIIFLSKLGLTIWLAPYHPSGKSAHILGFDNKYNHWAEKRIKQLEELSNFNIPMIGIEPAVALMNIAEYKESRKANGNKHNVVKLYLLQEWLAEVIKKKIITEEDCMQISQEKYLKLKEYDYCLISHCTEKTNFPNAANLWQEIFDFFGLKLNLLTTGCCGMSGMFGHLAEKKTLSEKIYSQSVQPIVKYYTNPNNLLKPDNKIKKPKLLATGYSCRTQVKRFDNVTIVHPISVLTKLINNIS